MTKYLIAGLLLFTSLAVFSQKQEVVKGKGDTLIVKFFHRNGKLQSTGKMRFSKEEGTWSYYNYNEVLVQEIDYKEGAVHGTITYYYSSGNKESQSNYVWGLQDGPYTVWNDEKELEIEGYYKDGLKDSLWTFYYLNGKKKKQLYYSEKDFKLVNYWTRSGKQQVTNGNGTLNLKYSNGNLMEKGSYSNGKETGMWTYGYDNGQTMSQGKFTNGKESGKWTSWFEDGNKKSELNYDNGDNTVWYQNGNKHMEGKLMAGMKEGMWSFWFEDGKKQMEAPYKEDKRHGKTTRWYKDGQKELEMVFSNGKQNGKATWWHKDGTLDMIGHFKNDIQHGEWIYYRKNGKMGNKGNYYEGKMDGEWTYWYNFDSYTIYDDKTLVFYNKDTSVLMGNYELPEEQIWKKCTYKRGVKDGPWLVYYENGQKFHEGQFLDGYEDGMWKSWYENGQTKSEGEYVEGIMNGLWKKWHRDGQKLSEIELDMGLKSGKALYWSEFGFLEKEEHYIVVEAKKNSEKVYVDEDVIERKSILHGTYITNYPNGKPNIKGEYHYGNKNGKWEYYTALGRFDIRKKEKEYYEKIDVKLTKTEEYNNGDPVGEWKSWYDEGPLESIINYKDGARNGKMVYYHKDGTVIYEAVYKMNELKKVVTDNRKGDQRNMPGRR